MPAKDEEQSHPIPAVWRATIRAIVDAFVDGDYMARGIPEVAEVDPSSAVQIESYIEDHGETLVPLPEETWSTSVCQWTGSHWDLLIDLYTEESGRSDMVLDVRVYQVEEGYELRIGIVYVPPSGCDSSGARVFASRAGATSCERTAFGSVRRLVVMIAPSRAGSARSGASLRCSR